MVRKRVGNARKARDPGDGASAAGKLTYRSPTLTVYGSVKDLTGSGTGGSSDGGMPMAVSDLGYKENVLRIGEHPAGFGIYLFDYKPEFREAFGHGRQFGVIAQEVEPLVPEAVITGADGYRRVNYAKLGIVRH